MTTTKHPHRAVTPRTWATALLHSMDMPTTPGNVLVIEEWEAREGGHWLNTARFNPLNTTQPEAGATDINSVHVKAYTSWRQGLKATRTTLTNGLYDPILRALKAGNEGAAISAVRASPWAGAGGYHTWTSPATARAYAKRTSPGGNFVVHPEPYTLSALSQSVGTQGKSGNQSWWVLAIVIVGVIVVLTRK